VSNFAQLWAGRNSTLFHALDDSSKAAQQEHWAAARENRMNYAQRRSRVYDPDALDTMGRAFDRAVRVLSQQVKAEPSIHQNLAHCILRLFDEGERSPLHLAIIALSIVDGRWHVSKERIAPFYPIGALIPSGTDRWQVAA
jgi:hypothetical protein